MTFQYGVKNSPGVSNHYGNSLKVQYQRSLFLLSNFQKKYMVKENPTRRGTMSTPIHPSAENTPATAAAIARQATPSEQATARIDLLGRAIFETERALHAPKEGQIAHIHQITEALHLSPPPDSLTPQEALKDILKRLREELASIEPKQKSEHEFWTHDQPKTPIAQPEEPKLLSELPTEVWANIVQHSDTKAVQNYALVNRTISRAIRYPQGEPDSSFLQRIYTKEEALEIIHSRSSKYLSISNIYEHLSPKLQMDEEIQRVYVRKNPKGIFDLTPPTDEQTPDAIAYRSRFNSLKKIAFLFANVPTRQKMIENEPGIDKILPEFFHELCTPEVLQKIEPPVTREKILKAIPRPSSYYVFFEEVAYKFTDDPDIVTLSAHLLLNGNPKFREYKKFAIQAVRNDGSAFQHLSKSLQNDRDIALAAIRTPTETESGIEPSCVLDYAGTDVQNDSDIVLAAVQQNGCELQFVSKELKNNYDIVLAAVRQNCWALQFASDELKNNREIVLAAVRQNKAAHKHMGKTLQQDPKFLAEIFGGTEQEYEKVLSVASRLKRKIERANKKLQGIIDKFERQIRDSK